MLLATKSLWFADREKTLVNLVLGAAVSTGADVVSVATDVDVVSVALESVLLVILEPHEVNSIIIPDTRTVKVLFIIVIF